MINICFIFSPIQQRFDHFISTGLRNKTTEAQSARRTNEETNQQTKKLFMFNALRRWSWIAWSASGLGLTYAFRLKTGRPRLRSRGISGALVAGHARGRGDWKGSGKIILAKRYCSDLQSQVRPGENFLSLR